MPRTLSLSIFASVLVLACQAPPADAPSKLQVDTFLDDYTEKLVELSYAADLADWDANTRIVEGDDSIVERQNEANAALAAFTGSQDGIEKTRALLAHRDTLEPLQVRQLEKILYRAANNPQTVPELVERRIVAESAQVQKLFGFDFQIDGKSVSANDVDRILTSSRDLGERLAAWDASKEVGKGLKDGLAELVELRNGTVRALGYGDYFEYQVSDYGMTVEEMTALTERFVRELWPLYRELHTWARHELAARYGEEVPELLPAHWLPNRWGQDWTALVTVEGIDLDSRLAEHTADWIVREAESFYTSLGFDPLPPSFYERSSLYPPPPDAEYKKNNHASAWHLDYGQDIRSLMSVEPDERWWATAHHELGHIYYYMSYTRDEVPVLLRRGANRGFHEAVGTLLGMASMQKAFLEAKGLVAEGTKTDEIQSLLKEALDSIIFIPFSAGTMSHFERDLYAGLPKDEYNARWWQYVRDFQGIVPPTERGEEYCDAASKTHVNDDAAQYYDYALSQILVYQLHNHIAEKILHQDPHNTNYFGRKDVGQFLASILEQGATADWRELMREKLGEEISAAAMLTYFAPLTEYLKEQNEGRTYTLPESPGV